MALKYTGRADVFIHDNKVYARDPVAYESEHGKKPDGSFDNVISGMSRAEAFHMMEQSRMHSFEEAGDDLLEKVTTPPATPSKKD